MNLKLDDLINEAESYSNQVSEDYDEVERLTAENEILAAIKIRLMGEISELRKENERLKSTIIKLVTQ